MADLLQHIVALFAISNPLGALPVFLGITENLTAAERTRAGLRAALAATTILALAALAGRPILAAFGVSMPALRAACGLVILLMGLEMLHGAPTTVQHDQGQQSTADRVLVPLAMPLLAGPGAITTVLTLSSGAETWRDTTMLLVAVVTVGTVIGIILASAARLGSLIGSRGQRILLRFMGLILAAVGAEILLAGVYTFEAELKSTDDSTTEATRRMLTQRFMASFLPGARGASYPACEEISWNNEGEHE